MTVMRFIDSMGGAINEALPNHVCYDVFFCYGVNFRVGYLFTLGDFNGNFNLFPITRHGKAEKHVIRVQNG